LRRLAAFLPVCFERWHSGVVRVRVLRAQVIALGLLLVSVPGGHARELDSRSGTDRVRSVAELASNASVSAFTPRTFHTRGDLRPFKARVTKRSRKTAPGYVFLTARSRDKGRQSGPMIVDGRGRLIWFHPVRKAFSSNLEVVHYKGRPALSWWEGRFVRGYGYGDFVVADNRYRKITRIKAQNGYQTDFHDVEFTPEGTVVLMIYSAVKRDLTPYGGPSNAEVLDNIVQEVDLETGRVLLEWHSLNAVGLDQSYRPVPRDNSEGYDYFHINSTDIDRDGHIVISARNTHAVYKLHRRTGALIWRLGGRDSSFKMGSGTRFAWQHDARMQSDGSITLFDNAAAPKVRERSRAIILKLDTQRMEAVLAREYVHPENLLASSQGSFQPLPGGNFLVGWGSEPYFSEYDQSGKLLLDLKLPKNVNSYRALRYPWRGRPAEKPAVAIKRRRGGATVYASWNGATGVARWQVLAGTRPNRLRPIRSRARKRFETAIRVRTKRRRYFAVKAKSSGGRTLGTSRTVER
jgi:hypothetical protein